jgi:hypothetical protein
MYLNIAAIRRKTLGFTDRAVLKSSTAYLHRTIRRELKYFKRTSAGGKIPALKSDNAGILKSKTLRVERNCVVAQF